MAPYILATSKIANNMDLEYKLTQTGTSTQAGSKVENLMDLLLFCTWKIKNKKVYLRETLRTVSQMVQESYHGWTVILITASLKKANKMGTESRSGQMEQSTKENGKMD